MAFQPFTLDNLSEGQVRRRIELELANIVRSFHDGTIPNNGKATLSINIGFKRVKEDSAYLDTTTKVTTKIPNHEISAVTLLGDNNIQVEETSSDAQQPKIFPIAAGSGK